MAKTKKEVFLSILRRRFPDGRFTFGDALKAYDDAHIRLYGKDDPLPKGQMGPRDVLRSEGAFFELKTHGRGLSRDGWPSTSKKGLVYMPTSKYYKEVMRQVIEKEIADTNKARDNAYSGTNRYCLDGGYYDKKVDELQQELRQYAA